jgi:hypothetical protein
MSWYSCTNRNLRPEPSANLSGHTRLSPQRWVSRAVQWWLEPRRIFFKRFLRWSPANFSMPVGCICCPTWSCCYSLKKRRGENRVPEVFSILPGLRNRRKHRLCRLSHQFSRARIGCERRCRWCSGRLSFVQSKWDCVAARSSHFSQDLDVRAPLVSF